MRTVQIFIVLTGSGGLVSWFSARLGDQVPVAPDQAEELLVRIAVPESPSSIALLAQVAFEAKFHIGVNVARHEDAAPPQVHKNHEPSRPGAESFPEAAAAGVRRHNWPFVNMPSVEGLARDDDAMITAHVPEMHWTNGIN
ncbi:MAG: cytochrome c [Boseongicola sp.]|nr:cytochrome c [Boseongicola sp.]